MARISSYPKDSTIQDKDAWIGTESTNRATRNFTAEDIASYVVTSTSGVTGSGTLNTIPLWTPDGQIIGDSIITQAASGQGVTITGQLDVTDDLYASGSTQLNGALTVEGISSFNDDVTFENGANFQSVVYDQMSLPGTAGQVLSSTGTNVEWVDSVAGSVTGSGTTNNLPLWSDGPNGVLADSQLRQLGPNGSGLYQVRMQNTDRFIIDKPSSVTGGDPEYLITQDGNYKVSMGWDDDGAGFGYLYNYAGDGWRFGSAGNNPELTIVTTANNEGVTIANNLEIGGTTITQGALSVESGLIDSDSTYGIAGQVLSTTGVGEQVRWVDQSEAITKLVPHFQTATPGGSDTYTQSNNIVDFDWVGGSGTYEYILPSATAIPYRKIRFVNNSTITASDKIHITAPGTETIDGGAFYEINKPYNGCAVWSDGVQWIVIQAKA